MLYLTNFSMKPERIGETWQMQIIAFYIGSQMLISPNMLFQCAHSQKKYISGKRLKSLKNANNKDRELK